MRHYIVIESDTSSVKKIKTIADGFDDMFFSGSTDNEKDALTLIFQNNPDIVFLDIDNTIDGLPEFLLDVNQHSNNQPAFIGLSFSEKNAFRAYRYDFFDYLLKPIVELNLCRSILKYKKKHPSKAYEMICLKSNKDYQYLNTDDILFLKADNEGFPVGVEGYLGRIYPIVLSPDNTKGFFDLQPCHDGTGNLV